MSNLSTFPDQIDVFITNQEIQASDLSDIQTFEQLQLIANKTSEQITQYNNLLNEYYDKIFTSQKLNKIQDCITNTETFFRDNTIGYIQEKQTEFNTYINTQTTFFNNLLNQFSDQGAYNPSTTYVQWNTVQYNGQTFRSKVNSNTGHTPVGGDTDNYWVLEAKQGVQGIQGIPGQNGVGLVFKLSYNDQTSYHSGECVEYLGSVYACIQDVQGVLPTNQTYWNIAISKGGSTILTTYRNSVTLTSDATNVSIGISYFNQYTDTLLVYQQGIYINPTVDYRINVNGTSIDKTDSTAWTNGTIFGFVVIKNVVSDMTYADGGMLQDGTVTEDKLTSDLQDKLNNNSFTIVKSNYTADSDEISEVSIGNSLYNPSTDDLKVKYLNEILTEGVNYTVSSDNLNIELLDWTLNNGDIVYFEITKKSINPITQLDGALIQEDSIPITKLTQGLQDEINGKANESDLVLHEAEFATYKADKLFLDVRGYRYNG